MKRESQIPLPDGRRLGYTEYGPPAGRALFLFHGQPGNRLFYPPGDAAELLNVRVIVPDRPGFGLSDDQPGRRLLDWPADVACLAGALGLRRFAVAGFSAGGPYAAACAAVLPGLVTRTGLISTLLPLDDSLLRIPLTPPLRINAFLARRAPALLGLSFRLYWPFARRDPLSFVRMSARQASTPDQVVLQQPEIANLLLRTWQENLRVDSRGYAHDAQILFSAWGFSPADLPKGVYLWHGEADANAPLAWGQALASAIPGCKASFLPGEGHFLIFQHWEEILTTLLGPISQAGSAKPAGPLMRWIALGRGRLGLSPRPGRKTFPQLREAGCTRLVTLLSAREDAPLIGQSARNHKLAWSWLPLPNGDPPEGETEAMFVRGLLELRKQIEAGDSAVLHCAAGIHRTGMAAYALLRLTGLNETQALEAIAEMRMVTREGIQPRHIAFGNRVAAQQAHWEQNQGR